MDSFRTETKTVKVRVAATATLRSNDADGNDNVQKTIGLLKKTTTLHVRHAFFFFTFLCPFLHDYNVKILNFAFYGERNQSATELYFSL